MNLQKYIASCSCGTNFKIETAPKSFFRIYCPKCDRIAFEYGECVGDDDNSSLNTEIVDYRTEANNSPKETPSDKHPVIGNYEVLKELGEGGMGKTFLARHIHSGEQAALKILKIDNIQDEEKNRFIDLFIREVGILQELDNPFIPKFKECGNYKGIPYLVMEYIQGQSLDKTIQETGPMKLSKALPIAYYTACALQYIYEKQTIVHRDIKPANIIILEQDQTSPKLIDFGLSKSLRQYYFSLTKTGTPMGTPYYMSPEQVNDAKRADHRSDIYSLGATFYHMLAGKPPFHQFTQTLAILHAILANKLIPLAELRPSLDSEIYRIVEKSMAFSAKDRYGSIDEFKTDLENFIKRKKK